MKKLRVLVLMHEDLVPPNSLRGYSEKERLEWQTEYDVLKALTEMGHDAEPLGVSTDLGMIRSAILEAKPDIVFNLLEEFHGVAHYDQNVVSYLELMRQHYTGCNPRGLLLAHDKPLSKKLLSYHRIGTPRFVVFPKSKAIKPRRRFTYPLLVKSAVEEASLGISQASIVHNDEKLAERVLFVHENFQTDALVEEYIEGREIYVGVMGNRRLQTFPPWEMVFTKMPEDVARIATRRVKWDPAYQEKHGIFTEMANRLPGGIKERLARLSKRIYRILNLSGYARLDFRLTPDGRLFVLEANPNPNLSYGEDFAESADRVGIPYESLIQRILNNGLRYEAAWRT